MEYVKFGNTGMEVIKALEIQLSPEDVIYLEETYVPHTVVGPQK